MARLLLILAALGLAAGYAGPLHPAGDSFAVLRPAAIEAVALFALFSGWRWALAGLALAALAAAPLLWDMRALPRSSDGLLVYQKNLHHELADLAPITADIRSTGADLVLLEELSDQNLAVTEALVDTHPHQLICHELGFGTVAILSRFPFTGPELCVENARFGAVTVAAPQGPLSVAVLHLNWPWPKNQAAHLDRLLPHLSTLPQPVVVGGDFNAMPWGHALHRVTQATGTTRAGPLRPTLLRIPVYPMAIDHILAPAGWQAHTETRPELGSDHRGLLARIAP